MSGRSGVVPVIPVAYAVTPENPDQVVPMIEDSVARADDAYWGAHVRKPFTWQRYTTWWVARRWVIPRTEVP